MADPTDTITVKIEVHPDLYSTIRSMAIYGPCAQHDPDFRPMPDLNLHEALTTILAVGHEMDLNETIRGYIVRAVLDGDPGCIDADAADAIVQVALHGELVYG
jgi:hypothetical protein